jgi:hypothetical protein
LVQVGLEGFMGLALADTPAMLAPILSFHQLPQQVEAVAVLAPTHLVAMLLRVVLVVVVVMKLLALLAVQVHQDRATLVERVTTVAHLLRAVVVVALVQ